MKRRAVRMLVLLWLVWYLCGPACEMFDFWDPPREEVHDVLFNAGGGVVLLGAGFGLALALFLKLRMRWRRIARQSGWLRLDAAIDHRFEPLSCTLSATRIHSPPILLRI